MTWNIIQGDCLEVLKSYPDNHFSSIVIDFWLTSKNLQVSVDYRINKENYQEIMATIPFGQGHCIICQDQETWEKITEYGAKAYASYDQTEKRRDELKDKSIDPQYIYTGPEDTNLPTKIRFQESDSNS
jgi:DNA modification methylase